MTTATDFQANQVLTKLLQRSREGRVRWRRLESLSALSEGAEQYEASLPRWSVILRMRNGELSASIIDSLGQRVGDIEADGSQGPTAVLQNLLAEARNQSNRLGDALTRLSTDLDEL